TYANGNNLHTLRRNVLLPIPGHYCEVCGKLFSQLCSKAVTIYQFDGCIENGLVMYYCCNHAGTMKSTQPPKMQYPNFMTSPEGNVFTQNLFQNTDYLYVGGCSHALVVDGNQKLRRRICFDKSNTIATAEISAITVGCDQTPLYGSLYCAIHSRPESTESFNDENNESSKQTPRSATSNTLKINEKHLRTKTILIQHESTSCSTLKKMPNEYVDKCLRSFGVIVYVTNCNVVVAFTEIFRSETIKEILNGLVSIVNISPSLPPAIIYDDACHLIRRLIDGQANGEINVTPAIRYLNTKHTISTECIYIIIQINGAGSI
ncbi:unnamed protein product, partial [Rotaria magnacalcarata]